jgi:hypothetical protein
MHPNIYICTIKGVKNHPKSSIIILKEHPKTLQNLFFLGIPKWIFFFWTREFGTRRNGWKSPKIKHNYLKSTQ